MSVLSSKLAIPTAGSAFVSFRQPGVEPGAFALLQAQQPMLRPPVQVAPPSRTAPTIRPTPSGFTPPSWWRQEPPPREFIPADLDPTRLATEDIFRLGDQLLRDREYREALDRLAEAARKAGAPADQVEAIRQDALGPSIGGSSIDKYRVGMAKLRQLQQLYQGKEWLQKRFGIPADQIDNVIRDGMRDNPENPFQGVFDRAYRYRRQKYEKLLRDLKMTPQPATAGAGKGEGRRHGWWDDEQTRSKFEELRPWLIDEQAGILLDNPEAPAKEVNKLLERIYDGSPYKIHIDPQSGKGPMGIDTTKFTSGVRTANGGIRNRGAFWREWARTYGDTLSAENKARIADGASPVIDKQWIKHFPEHAPYMGETLIHHHLDRGPIAIPLPTSVHARRFGLGILHP